MAEKAASRPRTMRQPLVVAALLVAYGNASTYLMVYSTLRLPCNMLLPNLFAVTLFLAWAMQRAGLSMDSLGLRTKGAIRSALWGVATGILLATPAFLPFVLPLLPERVTYPEIARLDRGQLLVRLLLELPIATALCEELAFRGALQALFSRSLLPMWSVTATNMAFAFWHVAVNYHTVSGTSLGATGLAAPAFLSTMVGVFVGGAVFSLLRLRTGTLVGSIVAHWLVDATLTFFAYAAS